MAPERTNRLREILNRSLGAPVTRVEPFREGVDTYVDLAVLGDGTKAIVRTAKFETQQTTYDGFVDWGEVLTREIVAAELLAAADVRVPRILAWSRASGVADDCSWMLAELIVHTPVQALSDHTQRQLGEIARRIHGIVPAGPHKQVLTPWTDWEQWVVTRIMRRLAAARAYMDMADDGTIRLGLARALAGRSAHASRLLHLDLRPPNLAIADDHIVAVFDFGNVICGDPYLELARLRQCDLLTSAFQEGYGVSEADLAAHADVLRAYSLDLTALLVVVSREEFDDVDLHREMMRRTRQLLDTLLS